MQLRASSFHGLTEEPLTRERMQGIEIQQRQEIDRSETPIQRRRSADFRAECQISSEKLRDFRRLRGELVE